ncbi:hypothetical protein HanXRQr2_Chr11g0501641 [Helianthus annuus]|uniref:Transposase (putative) gypsy type domain-containing protein n=1 Tax=Helianthus annuus TaxID=4232 RepID=A0A9K3HR72_HELAN|nr:hypothetical protein HanXRQr2_Chr11g0501641 [Helianthus annuus]KAJ0876006.1 hypothetical protein HanPSC8_Chr11g0483461 [Helianthus annuus]
MKTKMMTLMFPVVVLKWSKGSFKLLMTTVQMADDWDATYPQEGETGADAPAGYITLWADFFNDGNLRLPVTVFVAEVLEYYHLHISQLSPFGMFRIRNFEYTFRAHGLPITVENFRRFYQLTVNTGFFSFTQRHGSLKLMTPPKGVTGWKKKFFYVKACAVYASMSFRNVNVGVSDEDIPVATAKTVDWFSRLRPIELKKLDNNQLWVLRMMLTRPDRKARPVLREKSGVDAVGLWRMFEPDFEGRVELIAVELKKGFNLEILSNFRVPSRAVLDAPVPGDARGILADLGKFEKRIPKKHAEKKPVKKTVRGRGKGRAEGSVAPSSVSEAAGTYRSCYRRYTDYVVVSDTLEGLGVIGSGAAAGGTAAGPPVVGEKRGPEQKAAGGGEPNDGDCRPKGLLRRKRNLRLLLVKSQDAGYSFFDFPTSPLHTAAAGAGVPKEPVVPKEPAAPYVGPVRDPTVEKTVEKTADQIFDTVDSSDNLISPNEGDGLDLRFSDGGKQKSDAEVRQHDAEPHKSSAGEKGTGSSAGGVGYDGPPIQPGESELEYYYRTYTQGRSTIYHRPPWTVMQGDDISNDPSACKEILGGLGTPFEVERARAAPRELRINQLSTLLVGSSIVANAILEDYKVLGRREEEAARMRAEAEELIKAARAGAEQLEKDRAAFEKQKQTSEWAATAQLKQVRTLAKLLSDERKSWNEKLSNERKKWNESWAKQNDNLFRARQELTNAKAANVALGREKAAAEAIAVKAQQAEAGAIKAFEEAKEAGARAAKALEEAEERESRSSKALEEANAERIRLDKVVASLQAEVQTREVAVTDLTARMTAAEERANVAVEARDALTSSFNQLEADREWMRSHGIARAIMDAPETAAGLDLVKQRARDAGFKVGYNRCISHMNVMSVGGVIEERSGFRDVDTEGRLNAAVASFYDTSLSCVEKLDDCLEAADYVDRLRMLYADAE